MQNLNETVDLYLRMDTSYALMITGNWGTGKTFYFKNNLLAQIKSTPVYSDNTKFYKPLHISLFGLKSIEEIQSEIFLSLYPLLKNKTVKLSASIGRSLLKGILHLKNLGSYYDYVTEVEINKSEWINFEDLLLCFDDLERISPSLNIEEFIGYVNSLVENSNAKVIIIANEGKITATNYANLKEKVIGSTIEFNPKLAEVFDSILNSRFKSSSFYSDFLASQKDYILTVFSQKSDNLRILIFALTYYQYIFSEFENIISSEPAFKSIKSEVEQNLLKFTISISIAYKECELSYRVRRELDQPSNPTIETILNSHREKENAKKNIENDKFKENLILTFYKNGQYYFYKSIYEFITGGSKINSTDLLSEIKNHYHIKGDNILPQYILFKQLNYHDCFNLDNSSYKTSTRQLLDFAYKGQFDISNYITIFQFAVRFENPLNLDISKLEKNLLKGLKIAKLISKYNATLHFLLDIGSDSEHTEHLRRIRDYSLQLNKELELEALRQKASNLEMLFYEDFDHFESTVFNPDLGYAFEPIFAFFDSKRLSSYILTSTNPVLWRFYRFLSRRYYGANYTQKPELYLLENLRSKITKINKQQKGKSVSGFIYSNIDRILDESIKKIKDSIG